MNLSELMKVLSDENRLKIFIMLLHDTYCICDIEAFLELKQANVSKHMKRFKELEIVDIEKKAKWTSYQISDQARLELKDFINYVQMQPLARIIQKKLQQFSKNSCTIY